LHPSNLETPLAELLFEHGQMPHRFFVERVSLPNGRAGDHVGDRHQDFARSLIGLGLEVIFYSLGFGRFHFNAILTSMNRAEFLIGIPRPSRLDLRGRQQIRSHRVLPIAG
jgi:hypothetical protein